MSLLDGGSPGGAGEVEDKVERYGSIAEVQAKMSDLVEQALVPESHGDLCGQLLEAAAGAGQHPAFVKLCVDAGLPSNLVHCLRIMRVVEFESAMHDNAGGVGGSTATTTSAFDASSPGEGEDEAVPLGDNEALASPLSPDDDRPRTERATERIGQLLVTLCSDKSAGVGEQIKPHLPGLLSLAVSAYPPNGAHVQETARAVVEALMGGCLNSSMVWLLHYNKVRVCACISMKLFATRLCVPLVISFCLFYTVLSILYGISYSRCWFPVGSFSPNLVLCTLFCHLLTIPSCVLLFPTPRGRCSRRRCWTSSGSCGTCAGSTERR